MPQHLRIIRDESPEPAAHWSQLPDSIKHSLAFVQLPGGAKQTLAVIAAQHGAPISIPDLANSRRVGKTTIKRHLERLESAGLIEVHRSKGEPNLYRLVKHSSAVVPTDQVATSSPDVVLPIGVVNGTHSESHNPAHGPTRADPPRPTSPLTAPERGNDPGHSESQRPKYVSKQVPAAPDVGVFTNSSFEEIPVKPIGAPKDARRMPFVSPQILKTDGDPGAEKPGGMYELYEKFVAQRIIDTGEWTRLEFFVAAEVALRIGKRPGALFRHLVRDFICKRQQIMRPSHKDEDNARARIRRIFYGE